MPNNKSKVNKINNTKIEKRAIGALTSLVEKNEYLDESFSSMDKELSWDGYIYVYNDKTFSVNSFESKIPVQIKGYMDYEGKQINKERVQYPVNLGDLRNYYNHSGVLYFRVILTDNRKEIFYSILYPSKIKEILDQASKKNNKRQISVTFNKLEKKPCEMMRICRQFIYECTMQGSGRGQIVPKAIDITNINEDNCLKATALGVSSPLDFMRTVSKGDVCFYTKNTSADIWYPITMSKQVKMLMEEKVCNKISINGKIFYEDYTVIFDSDGNIKVQLSTNLVLYWNIQKFGFDIISTTKELANDAEFLFELKKNNEILVGDIPLSYSNPKLGEGLEEELNFIIDWYTICQNTMINIEKDFSKMSDNEKRMIEHIVEVYRGEHAIEEDNLYTLDLKIDDKIYPFFVLNNGKENFITNRVYESKIQSYVVVEDKSFKVPLFCSLNVEDLMNLYKYDYAELYHQVDCSDINESTLDVLNIAALTLIQVYDKIGDLKLLELARYIIKKLISVASERIYLKLNNWQIKKRLNLLDDNDRKEIKSILRNTNDAQVKCGLYLLIDKKKEANDLLKKIPKGDREIFINYPISIFL